MSEGAAATPPDPNYILSQEEFHRSVDELFERQVLGNRGIKRAVSGEADALVATAGWVCVSLAFWLLMIGFLAIRGQLRGRP